ncbi:MAG TPA: hypothetical protein VHC01_03155 [Gaiellaceae bacterium]|jgi:hypothetical protein|nr:hypothetical protein [Gaiellaceae bacterium]
MRIERYDDVAGFYERVEPFLLEREGQHAVQLGLRSALERDPHTFGPGDPVLLAAVDDGAVVGAATQTPPHPLLLSEMSAGAIEALVEELRGTDLPGLVAPVPVGSTSVERWPLPATVPRAGP